MCTKNTARGACQEINTAQGKNKTRALFISWHTPSCCISKHTRGSALSNIRIQCIHFQTYWLHTTSLTLFIKGFELVCIYNPISKYQYSYWHFFCIKVVTTFIIVQSCHCIVNVVTTLTILSQGCDLVTRLLKHVHHFVHHKQPCHNLAISLLQLYFYMGSKIWCYKSRSVN